MEGGFKHALIPQQAAAAETNTELRGEDGFFGQQLAKNGVAECLRRRTGSFICIESSYLSFGNVFDFRYEPLSHG